jgi:hypothetical protein
VKYEFRENWRSDSHTLLKGVSKSVLVNSIFPDISGQNSVQKTSVRCQSAIMSFMKVGIVKGIHYLRV